MKKQLFNNSVRDLCFVVIGIMIMGFGSAFSYKANIGSGSIHTLVQGVHRFLNISEGRADILISIVFLFPMFFLAYDLVGMGTVISVFGVGISVELGKIFIGMLNVGNSWITRIILYFIGSVVSSLGASIYISTNAGIGSLDAAIILLYRMTDISYANSSIVINVVLTIVGWLLGGTVGLGTFLGTITGSYISEFFMKRVYKWIGKENPLKKTNIN